MKFKNADLLVIAVAMAAFGAVQGLCRIIEPYAKTVEAWNKPVDPFRIMGNIYYVGASDVSGRLSVLFGIRGER